MMELLLFYFCFSWYELAEDNKLPGMSCRRPSAYHMVALYCVLEVG